MRAVTARLADGEMNDRLPVRWLLRRPGDSIAGGVAIFAAIAILVNALFMQSGPHPAPIFANKPVLVTPPISAPLAALPQRKPVEIKAETAPSRSDTVAEIQKELGKRVR